jgi:hypothetical protein
MTMVNKDTLQKASPKTKRAVRYEFELEHVALECIFAANNTREFRLLMEAQVTSDHRFDMLPEYRRVAVWAYVRGCLDARAHAAGLPLNQPPDAVQPKPRQASSTPPKKQRRAASIGDLGTSVSDIWSMEPGRMAARRPTTQ